MANPIAGTNAGSILVYNAGSGAFQHAKPAGFCVDSTGTYAYVLIAGWFGAGTTLNGAVSIGATSIVLTSAANYQPAGYINITDNGGNPLLVQYTSITTNTLNGVTGVTENINSGNAVRQAETVAQVQLSNLTAVGGVAWFYPLQFAPVNASGSNGPAIWYDNANSLVCYVASGNKAYSLPITGGASPWPLTQIGAGTLSPPTGSAWGGLTYDPTIGIVWNSTSTNQLQISGFYYKDPLAVTADFVAAYHPMVYYCKGGAGTNPFLPGNDAIAWTAGAARMAVCLGSNFSYDLVMRWRNDQKRVEVIADGAGATNSSNNGATAGTAISNPTSMVYDASGRLYIFSAMSMYYADPTTEILASGPTTLTGGTGVRNPRYLPSGGYTGGGATAGQIAYLDGIAGQGTLYIAY